MPKCNKGSTSYLLMSLSQMSMPSCMAWHTPLSCTCHCFSVSLTGETLSPSRSPRTCGEVVSDLELGSDFNQVLQFQLGSHNLAADSVDNRNSKYPHPHPTLDCSTTFLKLQQLMVSVSNITSCGLVRTSLFSGLSESAQLL